MADIVLLYVPCGSEAEATKLASSLLEQRLIACANIYQSRSLYHWEGKLAEEEEFVLICKTLPSRASAAESAIRAQHSYKVPCIVQIQPARVNHEYATWVAGEIALGGLAVDRGAASLRSVAKSSEER
jgi:periplasmic divalent cation tolerance protein